MARIDFVVSGRGSRSALLRTLTSLAKHGAGHERVIVALPVDEVPDPSQTIAVVEGRGWTLARQEATWGDGASWADALRCADAQVVVFLAAGEEISEGFSLAMADAATAYDAVWPCSNRLFAGGILPPGATVRSLARALTRESSVRSLDGPLWGPLAVHRRALAAAGGPDPLIRCPETARADLAQRLRRRGRKLGLAPHAYAHLSRPMGGSNGRDARVWRARWKVDHDQQVSRSAAAVRDVAVLPSESPTSWPPPDPCEAAPEHESLKILTILPTLKPYGGVVSALNLAEQFIDRGHRCIVGSLSAITSVPAKTRLGPVRISDPRSPEKSLPTDADILIATSWETVDPVVRLSRIGERSTPFYFVQDLEADLLRADRVSERDRVHATYRQLPNIIVKTRYLQERLERLGVAPVKLIGPGMDLDLFVPRPASRPRRSRGRCVLAMARPNAPNDHRGYSILCDVYKRLAGRRSDCELVMFGFDPDEAAPPFVHTAYNRLDPYELPRLYQSADVFVDTSRFHGFGRTGVEAMACGTPCVLSDSGGISEYAVNGENALIVPVGDVDATVDAVERILDDEALAGRLREAGLQTVQAFDDRVIAQTFLSCFQEAMAAGRPGTTAT